MKVIEYNDVNAFYSEYGQILSENEAVSRLILQDVFSCLEDKTCLEGKGCIGVVFGSIVDDMSTLLLYCKLPSHCIVLHLVNGERIEQAVQKLVDYLIEDNYIVNEIRGNNDVCLNFIESYKKNMEFTYVQLGGMDIMEIRMVHDMKQADGVQRLASQDDAKLVTDWMIESQLESKSSEMDYEAVLKKAVQYIDEQKVFLFEKDDIVVSMVIKERKIGNGMLLSYVFTPVEYRGEGYAAANVYYLCKALLEEGCEFCAMLVDKKNPLSVRAYEKIGFELLDDIYVYKIFFTDN